MKRASSLSKVFEITTPWLAWWQELILNWVATWQSIDYMHVCSSATDDCLEWDVPSDVELARMELEELLDVESGQR